MKKLALLGLGLWWLTKPATKDSRMKAWRGNFSHRGLHDEIAPENTRAAFEKSLAAGLGFECDVQLTKDQKLVIHHDFRGDRSFHKDVRLDELTLNELQQYQLFDSDQVIMTLEELLELVAGRVGIILEIKADRKPSLVSRLVAQVLDHYDGPVVIESFHPMVLWWFRRHRPSYLRGQLSWNSFGREKKTVRNFLLSNYLFNFLSRPHFVAHSFDDRQDCGLKLQHWLHRSPMVVYTIKNQDQADEAQKQFDTIIFEGYQPRKK